jgi:anti-sigma-K factor RskA
LLVARSSAALWGRLFFKVRVPRAAKRRTGFFLRGRSGWRRVIIVVVVITVVFLCAKGAASLAAQRVASLCGLGLARPGWWRTFKLVVVAL